MLESLPPFEDVTVYGPYLATEEASPRRRVTLRRHDGSSTTMSFARYLLCIREGRYLSEDEEADHIDEDPLNDEPGNLQILTPGANKSKSAKPKTMVSLVCPVCEVGFDRERRQTHLVKGGRPSCCSRRCGAIRGARVKVDG